MLSCWSSSKALGRVPLTSSSVIAGLDPAIHLYAKKMDPRVKPAGVGANRRINFTGICSRSSLTVIYSARTIRSSSYQMEPETNCSDGDRASRASRTYCARHSAFGIEKENSNSFQGDTIPTTIGLSPIGIAVAPAHVIRHRRPRRPEISPLYLPCNL